MRKIKFMKTNILWGILLLTVSLFVGSCSKDSIAPAPEFELVTEMDGTNPLFVSPDQVFKIEYNAKNIKSVTTSTLPEGWTAEIDESGKYIFLILLLLPSIEMPCVMHCVDIRN